MFQSKHIPWEISEARRQEYARSSIESQRAKVAALRRAQSEPEVPLTIAYDPRLDMPILPETELTSLSLFSGGGGLDLGFDRAGFRHLRSYDILEFAGDTLRANRPKWRIMAGASGNVRHADWASLRQKVDIIHGGPPCQPFSIAGRREGKDDGRDMFPEFLRAIKQIEPKVFLVENVIGFLSKKFDHYRQELLEQVSDDYNINMFTLSSADFGVPQDRRRAFIFGSSKALNTDFDPSKIKKVPERRGVRAALGLPATGTDGLAPTLRCTLTGPRQTTSIANSTASVDRWRTLGIWPHGVSSSRSIAASFPTKDQTYRLCVEECQALQGFPLDWVFQGAVYQRLGLIGNSVCPPVAYSVAASIRDQIFNT